MMKRITAWIQGFSSAEIILSEAEGHLGRVVLSWTREMDIRIFVEQFRARICVRR
jgi:hypothetical protein